MSRNSPVVRRYNFDLSKTAAERWGPIFDDYSQDQLISMKSTINNLFVEREITGIVRSTLNWLVWFYSNKILYKDEIQYVASRTGLDFEQVLLLQLMYELNSACTTLITNVNGKRVMYRTMDWDLPFLRNLTIELSVRKNGREICIVPTWVGCIGFFTAYVKQWPENFAFAINYRRTTTSAEGGLITILQNAYRTMKLYYPVSYLLRQVCESECDYQTAQFQLSCIDLISPCYITCYHPSNPITITRDAKGYSFAWVEGNNYQTNIDYHKRDDIHAENIIWSKERIQVLETLIEQEQDNFSSVESLLEKVDVWPIKNIETIYACVMDEEEIMTQIVQ